MLGLPLDGTIGVVFATLFIRALVVLWPRDAARERARRIRREGR